MFAIYDKNKKHKDSVGKNKKKNENTKKKEKNCNAYK
jgi:hypothetical protein